MNPLDPKDPLTAFEALVSRIVVVPPPATVVEKMSALERLIEHWRIERHMPESTLEFEDFERWKWFADTNQLHFAPPADGAAAPRTTTRSTRGRRQIGTSAIRLQRKLLVFLLLHHGSVAEGARSGKVNRATAAFVAKIRLSLGRDDFKRLQSGRTRIYTNTSFAATILRGYGLFRFGQKEAYKTWVLSLPGFLVAALASVNFDWSIPEVERAQGNVLDPFILDCYRQVADYPAFVEVLGSICAPGVGVFETFEPMLRRAHELLRQYWDALQDPSRKEEGRRRSRELLDQLEGMEHYAEFLQEFSACIQVEDVLKRADEAAKRGT